MKRLLPFALLMPCLWSGAALSPAELAIQTAQAEIAQHADYFDAYNHLANAYIRRARETGDASFLAKAEEPLARSMALAPDNYEGRKAGVTILLGRGQWKPALEAAQKLNRETPDDLANYAAIADAQIALGDYKSAIDAAQWMLNLRPSNPAGLIRAGRLREIYKDWPGSLEIFQTALDATAFAEREERAWIITQMARVKLEAGDAAGAESTLQQALAAFPDYHLALEVRNRIRAQGRPGGFD